ncbi:MAG: hypothetical protein E7283_08700 [Lachnospiraceae bacterium]|nr:hypothetical protein [Lachnospiraceae bacterium]
MGERRLQKIVGYHGTKVRNVDSILKDGFKIATPKEGDNHWLGHGIYFYSDYELANWWAKTKVSKHNDKYGENDVATVLRAIIEAESVWDLDSPFVLKQFKECQKELEEQFVEQGVVLDFSQGRGKPSERIRCFWMDAVKQAHNIQVIIYTFTRNNPSYVDSKYHIHSEDEYPLASMGLAYHEKQICVTENSFIVDINSIDDYVEEFDEVII